MKGIREISQNSAWPEKKLKKAASFKQQAASKVDIVAGIL